MTKINKNNFNAYLPENPGNLVMFLNVLIGLTILSGLTIAYLYAKPGPPEEYIFLVRPSFNYGAFVMGLISTFISVSFLYTVRWFARAREIQLDASFQLIKQTQAIALALLQTQQQTQDERIKSVASEVESEAKP